MVFDNDDETQYEFIWFLRLQHISSYRNHALFVVFDAFFENSFSTFLVYVPFVRFRRTLLFGRLFETMIFHCSFEQ